MSFFPLLLRLLIVFRLHIYYDHVDDHNGAQDNASNRKNLQHKGEQFVWWRCQKCWFICRKPL